MANNVNQTRNPNLHIRQEGCSVQHHWIRL